MPMATTSPTRIVTRARTCPVDGCDTNVPSRLVLCAAHTTAARRALTTAVARRQLRPDWRASAACAGADTDAWYPEDGLRPDEVALATCGGCPVRDDCLLEAAINREPGWWGGANPRSRRRLLTPARTAARAA